LEPIAAPTHYLAGRDDADKLGYWVPSARHLEKSERAVYEWLGGDGGSVGVGLFVG